jgi:hypothetical protein
MLEYRLAPARFLSHLLVDSLLDASQKGLKQLILQLRPKFAPGGNRGFQIIDRLSVRHSLFFAVICQLGFSPGTSREHFTSLERRIEKYA